MRRLALVLLVALTLALPATAQRGGGRRFGFGFGAIPRGVEYDGRFTIIRFVARGGMGAVYEATDVLLRSRVALKLLEGPITTDAAAIERFRRERILLASPLRRTLDDSGKGQ